MDKKKALYLLENAVSESAPVLVHGTCTAATMQLLSKGSLPSRNLDYFKKRIKTRRELEYLISRRSHPAYNGYLFFVPRKKSLVNHPLYNEIKVDLDGIDLIDDVAPYASSQESEQFLRQEFGYWPMNLNPNDIAMLFDEAEYDDLERQVLIEAGLDLGKMLRMGLRRIKEEMEKIKGVVIGVNEKIFEKTIENGHDDPGEEVMIYLPKGFEIQYVRFIYPLGPLEDRVLRDFIKRL